MKKKPKIIPDIGVKKKLAPESGSLEHTAGSEQDRL
jgi:hypothetical protein